MKPVPFGRKPPPDPDPPADADDIYEDWLYAWRYSRFARLGFDSADAIPLAQSRVDYHQVERLLTRGASHSQARRIVL